MLRLIKKMIEITNFSIRRIALSRKKIFIDYNVSFLRTRFSNYNRIFKNTNISFSSIGPYTYISNDCFLFRVQIGAFTSIGPRVEVIYGTHPINFVSTNPVFYSTRKQCGTSFVKENLINDFTLIPNTNLSAIIGNDVWIGYGVKIIEGITIGDGAIVLAGAYVTKDVEPYSIVGGIPAKHMKFRFNEKEKDLLLKFKWWEKDIDWIKKYSDSFIDINTFINIINKL